MLEIKRTPLVEDTRGEVLQWKQGGRQRAAAAAAAAEFSGENNEDTLTFISIRLTPTPSVTHPLHSGCPLVFKHTHRH